MKSLQSRFPCVNHEMSLRILVKELVDMMLKSLILHAEMKGLRQCDGFLGSVILFVILGVDIRC